MKDNIAYMHYTILHSNSIFNIALSVAFQTPSSVQVPCFLDTYPIFCIGSKHDITTRYIWDLFGSDNIFPDSPVLYAKQPGLYQCTVIHYDERAESKVINIEISPGNGKISLIFMCCIVYTVHYFPRAYTHLIYGELWYHGVHCLKFRNVPKEILPAK